MTLPSDTAQNRAVKLIQLDVQTRITLTDQSPWPGLAAYDEAASEFFYGRKEEAIELLRMIRLSPLTVLFGKSGLGKSSLLQAGLYPLLRAEHYFPVHLRIDLTVATAFSSLDLVLQQLVRALSAAQVEYPLPSEQEGLWRYLHRRDLEIWSKDNYLLKPVLVFDQFEEVFAKGECDPAAMQSTLDALADLIENRIPQELTTGDAHRQILSELDLQAQRYRIVLSFREDFLPDIEHWKEQVPSLLRNRLRLLPMSRERAIEAVKAAGAAVLADSVAEPLVDFIGNLDVSAVKSLPIIEPVLLSLCCYQLNQRRAPGHKIDIELLQHAGQDILQDFYHEALAGMPETVSEFIETHLIQGNRYRSSYPVDQALHDKFLTEEQLTRLTNQHRLLRIDQQLGISRIELIHDRLVSVVSQVRDERLRKLEIEKIRAKEKERQRQLALSTALEKQATAEALAAERLRATKRAQADAARLRKQAKQLQWALLSVMIMAILAGYGFYNTQIEKKERKLAQRESISLRLVSESLDIANDLRPGGDERALLQLLAAKQITPNNRKVDAALIHLLNKKVTTDKIWNIGAAWFAVTHGKDHPYVLALSNEGQCYIWNTQEAWPNEPILTLDRSNIVALAISNDSLQFAIADHHGEVQIWHRLTKTMVRHFKSLQPIFSISFSPENQQLAIGSKGTIQFWDLASGNLSREIIAQQDGAIRAIAFSSDGSEMISGGDDKLITIWDTKTDRVIGEPLRGHVSPILSVAFSADGTLILSGGEDKLLRLWDRASSIQRIDPLRGHEATISSAIFAGSTEQIISGSRDGTIRFWSIHDHPLIDTPMLGHEEIVTSVAYHPDGNRIVSGSDDKSLRLWDAWTAQPIGEALQGHDGTLNGAVFSPDGLRIVSGASDGTLRFWDGQTGLPIGEPLKDHLEGVETVAYSPDGKFVASGSKDKTIRLWEAQTGKRYGNPLEGHEDMVRSVAFSPDSKMIVSASYDHTLQRWEVATGNKIGSAMEGHSGHVVSVAVSPDGQYIASGSKDKTVRLWDAQTGQPINEPMQGHEARVNSVAFSPDSRRIISGSHDMTLRLWDVKTGLPIGDPFSGHLGAVTSTVFSPDGSRILSGSADKTLRMWMATTDWVAELCNKLTRNMSHAEWQEWISPNTKYRKQCPNLPVYESNTLIGESVKTFPDKGDRAH